MDWNELAKGIMKVFVYFTLFSVYAYWLEKESDKTTVNKWLIITGIVVILAGQ